MSESKRKSDQRISQAMFKLACDATYKRIYESMCRFGVARDKAHVVAKKIVDFWESRQKRDLLTGDYIEVVPLSKSAISKAKGE